MEVQFIFGNPLLFKIFSIEIRAKRLCSSAHNKAIRSIQLKKLASRLTSIFVNFGPDHYVSDSCTIVEKIYNAHYLNENCGTSTYDKVNSW